MRSGRGFYFCLLYTSAFSMTVSMSSSFHRVMPPILIGLGINPPATKRQTLDREQLSISAAMRSVSRTCFKIASACVMETDLVALCLSENCQRK